MKYLSIILAQILKAKKNQRGDPCKSKIFLLRGVDERGWISKTLLRPHNKQKTKISLSVPG